MITEAQAAALSALLAGYASKLAIAGQHELCGVLSAGNLGYQALWQEREAMRLELEALKGEKKAPVEKGP
jgi:hypothetical protein